LGRSSSIISQFISPWIPYHPMRSLASSGRAQSTAGYFPVPTSSFVPGTPLPCDIIIPIQEDTKLSEDVPPHSRGEMLTERHLQLMDGCGAQFVYIRKDGHSDYQGYILKRLENAALSRKIPLEDKIRLVYDAAEYVIRKASSDRPAESDIFLARQVIDSAALILTTQELSVENLCSFFSRDYQLSSHSVQVAMLGMSFCRHLNWERSAIADWGLGALLHDVGKGPLEDRMLVERFRLTVEEFEVMKKHTLVGQERLRGVGKLSVEQMSIILSHHESMDGSGYPEGLQGHGIHEFARIARIVDHYDTLVTKRPHKQALNPEQALRAMRKEAGSSFDEQILSSFMGFMGFGEAMNDKINGNRINIELGSELLVELVDGGIRFKSTLVGMKSGEYLIVRSPEAQQVRNQIYEGSKIIARCVHSGNIYGFRSKILCNVVHPAVRLLVLEYPRRVESVNIRKNPRVDCHLPAEIADHEQPVACVIADISLGGCKLLVKPSGIDDTFKPGVDRRIALQAPLLSIEGDERLTGVIRNIRADGDMIVLGVSFVELSENITGGLSRFIDSMLALLPLHLSRA